MGRFGFDNDDDTSNFDGTTSGGSSGGEDLDTSGYTGGGSSSSSGGSSGDSSLSDGSTSYGTTEERRFAQSSGDSFEDPTTSSDSGQARSPVSDLTETADQETQNQNENIAEDQTTAPSDNSLDVGVTEERRFANEQGQSLEDPTAESADGQTAESDITNNLGPDGREAAEALADQQTAGTEAAAQAAAQAPEFLETNSGKITAAIAIASAAVGVVSWFGSD